MNHSIVFTPKQSQFLSVSNTPVSYWLGDRMFDLLKGSRLGDIAIVFQGTATADDGRFVRFVWEVKLVNWKLNQIERRWVPFEKGGGYGKWFGHHYWAVDWQFQGARIRAFPRSVIRNEHLYFQDGWTYSRIARGAMGCRQQQDGGSIVSDKGPGVFSLRTGRIGLLNTHLFSAFLRTVSPNLAFEISSVVHGPLPAFSSQSMVMYRLRHFKRVEQWSA